MGSEELRVVGGLKTDATPWGRAFANFQTYVNDESLHITVRECAARSARILTIYDLVHTPITGLWEKMYTYTTNTKTTEDTQALGLEGERKRQTMRRYRSFLGCCIEIAVYRLEVVANVIENVNKIIVAYPDDLTTHRQFHRCVDGVFGHAASFLTVLKDVCNKALQSPSPPLIFKNAYHALDLHMVNLCLYLTTLIPMYNLLAEKALDDLHKIASGSDAADARDRRVDWYELEFHAHGDCVANFYALWNASNVASILHIDVASISTDRMKLDPLYDPGAGGPAPKVPAVPGSGGDALLRLLCA